MILKSYLDRFKISSSQVAEIWKSTSSIAANLGNFEDKNFFSKVDVSIKVIKESKNLFDKLTNKKISTPYLDKWRNGVYLGVEMHEILEKLNWNSKIDLKEINYRIFEYQEADFSIITLKNLTNEENVYNPSLVGNEESFAKCMRKNFIDTYGKIIILNIGLEGFLSSKFKCNFENEVVSDLEENLKAYLRSGVGRNILLYGPPGTGKTSIAYSLAHRLGICLIIQNLSTKLNNYYLNYINIIKPDVIIIDDIDRVPELDDLLSQIESLKQNGRIVIATANKIHKLDSAVLRPGRFDKLIKVDKTLPQIVHILVEHDQELFEITKDFTIASINELMIRIKVEGKEKALANMDDLILRDREIKQEYSKL